MTKQEKESVRDMMLEMPEEFEPITGIAEELATSVYNYIYFEFSGVDFDELENN